MSLYKLIVAGTVGLFAFGFAQDLARRSTGGAVVYKGQVGEQKQGNTGGTIGVNPPGVAQVINQGLGSTSDWISQQSQKILGPIRQSPVQAGVVDQGIGVYRG